MFNRAWNELAVPLVARHVRETANCESASLKAVLKNPGRNSVNSTLGECDKLIDLAAREAKRWGEAEDIALRHGACDKSFFGSGSGDLRANL